MIDSNCAGLGSRVWISSPPTHAPTLRGRAPNLVPWGMSGRAASAVPVRALTAALALALASATPRPALAGAGAEDETTGHLLLAGAGMAIPVYFLGVAWHEGTHAVVAKSFGAEILELRLLPGMYEGHFYFGLTRWQGHLTLRERAFTLIAPKLVDLVLLGGYSAIVLADGLPENEYGSLALTVFATGAWVDFSKDLFSWNPTNDVVRFHQLQGRTTAWRRLPWRLLHAGLTVAAAYVLVRGYQDVFDDDPDRAVTVPLILRLAGGSF